MNTVYLIGQKTMLGNHKPQPELFGFFTDKATCLKLVEDLNKANGKDEFVGIVCPSAQSLGFVENL